MGGFAGAGVVEAGFGSLDLHFFRQDRAVHPGLSLLGVLLGAVVMRLSMALFLRMSALVVDPTFQRGQLVSTALYSLGHGGNDAQKTMGIASALGIPR